MKQYDLNDRTLILKVKKAPLFGRIIVFLVAFVSFIFPTIAIINAIISKEFQIGYVIAILVFWVIGFYMLRIGLWNTYGREIISFKDGIVEYQPDYGWFKDDKKYIKFQIFTLILNRHLHQKKEMVFW